MGKPAKKGGKKRVKGRDYYSIFLGIGIVALLAVISFFLFKSAFEKGPTEKKPPAKTEKKAEVPPAQLPPVKEEEPAPVPPEKPVEEKMGKAVLSIVIDDMGGSIETARTLAAIDPHITFAVMPHEAHSAAVAREMGKHGHDVILHLPMEPKDLAHNKPGKGALLLSMSPAELADTVEDDLKLVPGVKGVNNHMGSRFTEDRKGMEVVVKELKKKGLYFLDSRTSPQSVGRDTAKQHGLRSASRDVFLDNELTVEYSRRQLQAAAELAKKKGRAIAIGHPHPTTIKALQEMVPELRKSGIEIVGVSRQMSKS